MKYKFELTRQYTSYIRREVIIPLKLFEINKITIIKMIGMFEIYILKLFF